MASINFIVRGDSETSSIYLRFKDGASVDLTAKTRFIINSDNWSKKGYGQPKNLKSASAKQLFKELTDLRTELLDHYNNTSGKLEINSQWLKDFITPPKHAGAIPNKLVDYFNYYALHKKAIIEASSIAKLNVNKHLIERFQKATKKEYLIKDVDSNFRLNLEEYCLKNNYAANTIARLIKFIKTICIHARNNGIETHFQLNSIQIKFEKVEKIFLTPEELDKIEAKKFEHEYLTNARDWLIVSCETGQRVSDFMRFNKDQIRYEGDVPLIEFTQVKTDKIMAIPLSKRVRAILKKRKGDFPRKISDQKYNEYIKEVCRLAGLTDSIKGSKIDPETIRKKNGIFPKHELVTSHIGRRSFATNNYGRIPTSLLINVTGHTTESMFLEYIGKTVTEKAIQLAEYF